MKDANTVILTGEIIGFLEGSFPVKFWLEQMALDRGKPFKNRLPCTANGELARKLLSKAPVGCKILIMGKLGSDPLTQSKNVIVESFLVDGDGSAFYEV